jgi:glycerol-3-phosphate acyltransferase PlsY
MSNLVVLIILAVCSYLLGNVNWALIISKLKKTDIRKLGSGNPGTLNMSRNLGLKAGLLTVFLDIMKGFLPCLVAFFVLGDKTFDGSDYLVRDFGIYMCGFCAVMGHIFPALLKFKGGKGIASTIGVMLFCSCAFGLAWTALVVMALVAALTFIYFTEFGAMGSFIAITPPAIGCTIRLYFEYGGTTNKTAIIFYVLTDMIIFALCLFTWFAHRHNIHRMLAGEEHPTSIKQMVVKRKAKKVSNERQTPND